MGLPRPGSARRPDQKSAWLPGSQRAESRRNLTIHLARELLTILFRPVNDPRPEGRGLIVALPGYARRKNIASNRPSIRTTPTTPITVLFTALSIRAVTTSLESAGGDPVPRAPEPVRESGVISQREHRFFDAQLASEHQVVPLEFHL